MSEDIVWSYRDSDWSTENEIVGFSVGAHEGVVGKVDKASTDVSGSWLVVDTGFWIFGKKRLFPAGTVAGIDHKDKRVIVNLSKDAIKDAPDYDPDEWDDEARSRHAEHYRSHMDQFNTDGSVPDQPRPDQSGEGGWGSSS